MIKLVLVFCYLLFVFLLVRFFEYLAGFGIPLSHTSKVIQTLLERSSHPQNPASTATQNQSNRGIAQLKAILNQRGVNYNHVFEKSELLQLIEDSGELSEEELEVALAELNQSSSSLSSSSNVTYFNNSAYFNELVEDCKDSVWLLKPDPQWSNTPSKQEEKIWNGLVQRYAKFGVRSGRIDCYSLQHLCETRGFSKAVLVLALPKGQDRQKDAVDFHRFSFTSEKPQSIPHLSKWIDRVLAERIKPLHSSEPLISKWRRTPKRRNGDPSAAEKDASSNPCVAAFVGRGHGSGDCLYWLRTMFVFKSDSPPPLDFVQLTRTGVQPLVLSALSVKFTGRVHFWTLDVGDAVGQLVAQQLQAAWVHDFVLQERQQPRKLPVYILFTRDRAYTFGRRPGEFLSFSSLDLFLSMAYPESNDLFILGLLLVNIMAVLQMALKQRTFIKQCMAICWCFLFYNVVYLVLCLPVIGLFSLRLMSSPLSIMLSALRRFTFTDFAAHIRWQYQLGVYSIPFMAGCLVAFSLIINQIESWRTGGIDWEEALSELESQQSAAGGSGVFSPLDIEHEVFRGGRELVMQHMLARPNLFLPMDICPVFLTHLPVWRHPLEGAAGTGAARWAVGLIRTEQCAVCLDSFKAGVSLCGLPCGHVYHDLCVKKWLMTSQLAECPTCRWPAYRTKMLDG